MIMMFIRNRVFCIVGNHLSQRWKLRKVGLKTCVSRVGLTFSSSKAEGLFFFQTAR
jgi:hypothetical protein